MARLVNLNPHEVTIVRGEAAMRLPAAQIPARCRETLTPTGSFDLDGTTIPLYLSSFGDVEGLPDPQPDTWFVVSRPLAESMPHRADLVVPAMVVRNDGGQVVACRGLARVWEGMEREAG